MSNGGMLRFEGVSKVWPDGTQALRDVSCEIPKGQFCSLLGPSGSGKSTLLKAVNGLVSPTAGRVFVDGVEVTRRSLRRIRPRTSMIHQQFELTGRLTVLQNVLTGLLGQTGVARSLLGLYGRDNRRRACELLAEVGLSEKHLYRRASRLSGGQQQRVAIARGFINRPLLVLADEPVASLDPKISADILRLLKATARQQGAAVLCSLHQVELAREFSDRVLALKDGRIAFDGPLENLTDERLRQLYHDTPLESPEPAPSAVDEDAVAEGSQA